MGYLNVPEEECLGLIENKRQDHRTVQSQLSLEPNVDIALCFEVVPELILLC